MARKIYRVQGDTGPAVSFQQEGIDISGFSARMNVRRCDGSFFDSDGEIVNAATGDWSFPFAAGDLDVVGEHELEFEITSSEINTYPPRGTLVLVVREQAD